MNEFNPDPGQGGGKPAEPKKENKFKRFIFDKPVIAVGILIILAGVLYSALT